MNKINSIMLNNKLMLFRISLKNLKLLYFNDNIRFSFINLLSYYLKDMDISEDSSLYLFLHSYANHLNFKDYNFPNDNQIDNDINTILNGYKEKLKTGNFFIDIIPFLGIKKYNFRIFFLFELLFIRYLIIAIDDRKNIKNHIVNEDINKLITYFKLNKEENILFEKLKDILCTCNFKELGTQLENLIVSSNNKNLIELSDDLLKNVKIITNYISLPVYNVGVFATMSAGKSTFINAILNKDFIPSKNEACTAKITSISDNDNMEDKIFGGCSLDDNKSYIFSNEITKQVIEEWNNNDDVDHIFLETDIKYIHSKKGILVIHDTPGANNSRNEKHGNITNQFLENSKIDLFIYLINAHNPTTNDNYAMMNNVYEAYNKNKNAKILFLINKIDDCDFESGETIEEIIDTVKKDIENVGFTSPIIIPLSADAARVFRKILKSEELTIKERGSFNTFYNIFEDDRMNLPSYYKDYKLYDNIDNSINTEEEYIIMKNNKYSTKKINDMLNKTSINLIRNIINKEINGSE
ncbi:dynamin family protein [Brachyspira innocens]|nr:dynamin family protein [Brachyspira innocens]MDO6993453.1 dynamin family protein [Brachyspira innocens]